MKRHAMLRLTFMMVLLLGAVLVGNVLANTGVEYFVEAEDLTNWEAFGPGMAIPPAAWLISPVNPNPNVDVGPYLATQDMTWMAGMSGEHLVLFGAVIGSGGQATLTLPDDVQPADFYVNMQTFGGVDFAVVEVKINGVVLGEFDLFADPITVWNFDDLGPVTLYPGENIIEFEIVDDYTIQRFDNGIAVGFDWFHFIQAD